MGTVIAIDKVIRLVLWVILLSQGHQLLGLVVGYLGGVVTSIGLGLYFTSLQIRIPDYQNFKDLLTFAKYSWLGSLRGASWEWVDILVLGMFVNSYFIGIYEVAWRISKVFLIVSSAIGEAIFPAISKLSEEGDYENITEIIQQSFRYAGVLTIPGIIGGLILGQPILRVFGEGFTTGRTVLVLLILAQLFSNYDSLFGGAVDAMDRPDLIFKISLLVVVSNAVLNIVLVATIGWSGAALATVVSGGITVGGTYYYVTQIVDIELPLSTILNQLIASVLMGIILLILATNVEINSLSGLLLTISVGAVVYALVVFLLDREIRLNARQLLKV